MEVADLLDFLFLLDFFDSKQLSNHNHFVGIIGRTEQNLLHSLHLRKNAPHSKNVGLFGCLALAIFILVNHFFLLYELALFQLSFRGPDLFEVFNRLGCFQHFIQRNNQRPILTES